MMDQEQQALPGVVGPDLRGSVAIWLLFGVPTVGGYFIAKKTKVAPPAVGAAVGFALPLAMIVHALRKFT
jgi:hypothetical protein